VQFSARRQKETQRELTDQIGIGVQLLVCGPIQGGGRKENQETEEELPAARKNGGKFLLDFFRRTL
jgi:hypothetical protein